MAGGPIPRGVFGGRGLRGSRGTGGGGGGGPPKRGGGGLGGGGLGGERVPLEDEVEGLVGWDLGVNEEGTLYGRKHSQFKFIILVLQKHF